MICKYRGYLLDLDGTIYRGNTVIPEARAFVQELEEAGKPYMFLTNNSSKTTDEVVAKLRTMGVPAQPETVYTSAMAMADYVVAKQIKRAFVIGENGLKTAIHQAGVEESDTDVEAVIVGIDRTFTFEKLETASFAIQKGAMLLATNGDRVIPTERGMSPGNGSILAAIEAAGGKRATVVGKPEAWIVAQAIQRLGTTYNDTLLVGDNYDTDILAGIRAKIDTLHVDTGVTLQTDAMNKNDPPTFAVPSLAACTISTNP
ncbi:TIGR01457 family HAD-type hydrolase [Geomicrobium sp. JSM 1781026]|uniref:TIGR01457 family HAD-type hydrolase n=1 Tax=Geomicrobium sp. JSM 1781026 TaxID=3344580 RepID=UPI0035C0FF11